MANLLPKTELNGIKKEYRFRLLTVILFFSLSTMLIASIALIPELIISSRQTRSLIRENEKLKTTSESKEIKDLLFRLKMAEVKVETLKGAAPQVRPLQAILAKLLSDKPGKTALSAIEIKTTGENSYAISISGNAPTREQLLSFFHTVEKEKMFSNVNLPISNFAPSSDINFSILLTSSTISDE